MAGFSGRQQVEQNRYMEGECCPKKQDHRRSLPGNTAIMPNGGAPRRIIGGSHEDRLSVLGSQSSNIRYTINTIEITNLCRLSVEFCAGTTVGRMSFFRNVGGIS